MTGAAFAVAYRSSHEAAAWPILFQQNAACFFVCHPITECSPDRCIPHHFFTHPPPLHHCCMVNYLLV
jgi:hypothetical protein